MITTKSVGIGVETANPKPVRGVNWCGNPMKEGESYWGESEPQQLQRKPEQSSDNMSPEAHPRPRPRKAKRERKAWSAEARAAYSQRMKAWWQAKKSSAPEVEAQEQGQQNNQQ